MHRFQRFVSRVTLVSQRQCYYRGECLLTGWGFRAKHRLHVSSSVLRGLIALPSKPGPQLPVGDAEGESGHE